MSESDETYIPADEFHQKVRRVYFGETGWAVNKKRELMARVLYEGTHQNLACEGERRGCGKNHATWVFAEEPGLEEGHFSTPFELMIDARFEPNASVGLHFHDRTEEIYYLIEGSMRMTTVRADGLEHTEALRPGDAHLVRMGQSHFGVAGPEGARVLVVGVRRGGG